MVASNIRLPNIRRMFAPDLGYTICDADLAGADAQVVAWEAGDEKLKDAFRKGLKIHIVNARDVWPDETRDMDNDELKATGSSGGMYYQIKRAVHGTNYYASPQSLVHTLGWPLKQAQQFQERWFWLHPEIKEWHERYERYLWGTQCWNCDNIEIDMGKPRCKECDVSLGRTVKNAFGFRRMYFERVDSNMLKAALAWTPQSTVAFCTELGWTYMAEGPESELLTGLGELTRLDFSKHIVNPESYDKWHAIVEFLLQVHDSIVFQVPTTYERRLPEIVDDLQVRVPYPDPLIIPMGYGHSRTSWGDCD